MSLSKIFVNNTQIVGVDDEPTAGSNNLVKSGGVLNNTIQHRDMLLVDPDFTADNNRVWYKFGNTASELELTYDPYRLRTVPIPVKEGQTFDVYTIAQTAANTVPSIVPLDDNFNPIINEVVQSSYTVAELIHYTASANAKYIICIAHAGTSPYPYVKCTSEGTISKEISDLKTRTNANTSDISILNNALEKNYFGGIAIDGTLLNGYYIDDNGGISDAITDYNLVKFTIDKYGSYYIGKDLYNSHPVLAKYTDSTYSQVEKIIISFADTQSFWKDLAPGYYAVCSLFKVPQINDVDAIVEGLLESKFKDKGNIPGISSLDELAISTWTKVSDGVYESSLQSTGFSSGMFLPYDTYEDSFFLKAVITPITAVNGNFEFMLAKAQRSSVGAGGTGIVITKDGNINLLSIGHFNGTQFQSCATASLSGIRFDVNRRLSVVLEKHIDERIWFSVSVTDDAGNVVEIPKVYDYIEDGEHISLNAGLGLGCVILSSYIGQWKAENFSFGYRKNPDTIKLAIMGHSFVAGQNSTVFNLDKRFAALLANDIGQDDTLIFGFGGGDYNLFNSFKKQVSWYQNVKYALICLGTNDNDTSAVCQQYQDFDTFLKANRIVPVWLTIAPSRDQGQLHPVLNAYIKANFNYIDVEQIFYNDNGTVNTAMFSDEVHPTIACYGRMYKVIISQMTQFVI